MTCTEGHQTRLSLACNPRPRTRWGVTHAAAPAGPPLPPSVSADLSLPNQVFLSKQLIAFLTLTSSLGSTGLASDSNPYAPGFVSAQRLLLGHSLQGFASPPHGPSAGRCDPPGRGLNHGTPCLHAVSLPHIHLYNRHFPSTSWIQIHTMADSKMAPIFQEFNSCK